MVDEEAIAEQLASAAYSYERSTYVVKVGDNVEKIAKKNRISVYNLCRLNNIRATSDLEPGRMLKLR